MMWNGKGNWTNIPEVSVHYSQAADFLCHKTLSMQNFNILILVVYMPWRSGWPFNKGGGTLWVVVRSPCAFSVACTCQKRSKSPQQKMIESLFCIDLWIVKTTHKFTAFFHKVSIKHSFKWPVNSSDKPLHSAEDKWTILLIFLNKLRLLDFVEQVTPVLGGVCVLLCILVVHEPPRGAIERGANPNAISASNVHVTTSWWSDVKYLWTVWVAVVHNCLSDNYMCINIW